MKFADFMRGFGGSLGGVSGALGGLGGPGMSPYLGAGGDAFGAQQQPPESFATLQKMHTLQAENAQLRIRIAALEKILKMTSVKEEVPEGSIIPIHDWTEEPHDEG